MFLRHNAFADDVNVAIVMKAMGAESDQEIIQMVGEEEGVASLLVPTLQDCKQKGIFTQGQALDYLGSQIKTSTKFSHPEKRRKSKVYIYEGTP